MSLNTDKKTFSNDELLKLNLQLNPGSVQLDRFVPGQTLSYSFMGAGNTGIFNQYKSEYGVSVSFDSGKWAANLGWSEDVNSVLSGASEIINLDFAVTNNVGFSDIRWVSVNDLAGTSVTGFSFLTPSYDMDNDDGDGDKNTGTKDAGILIYNKTPFHETEGNSSAEAEIGGSNERTITILHEFGHFLGLSHPHIGSNTANAPFVELNDSRYDLMSYVFSDDDRKTVTTSTGNGGFSIDTTYDHGTFVNYTPINIAQLQYLYGANTTTHTGDNVYTLTDAKTAARDLDGSDGSISIGRAYYTIWDNGGTDSIAYNGSNRVLLNLNAATLDRNKATNDVDLIETLDRVANSDYFNSLYVEVGNAITNSKYYAGGFFSQILTNDDDHGFSIDFGGTYSYTLGGYAIANGVKVENATGGSDNDIIIGNDVANIISGNAGNDSIFDGNGDDTVNGGANNDIFYVGRGNDTFDGGAGNDKADFTSSIASFQFTTTGGTITIQDLTGKYGTNTFVNVEKFIFAGTEVDLISLPSTQVEYERKYADLLHNDLVADLGGLHTGTIDTKDVFWGTTAVDQFFAELLNDRFEGDTGIDIIEFKGNKADFNFTIGTGNDLIVTSVADSTQYDVLHSVEQLSFDDGVGAVTATDLGLSSAAFTTWQNDFDFG